MKDTSLWNHISINKYVQKLGSNYKSLVLLVYEEWLFISLFPFLSFYQKCISESIHTKVNNHYTQYT